MSTLWSSKPWWCQPWTLVTTGSLAVVLSWLALKLWWLTAAVALMVLLWWYVFLVLAPAEYRRLDDPGA